MVQEAGQRVVDAAGARSAMPAPSATHTSPAAVAATAAGQQPPAGLGGVGDGGALGRGLQHDCADAVDARRDGVALAADGDGALRAVREHLARDLWVLNDY